VPPWLTHTQTDRQLLIGYTISSARWAKIISTSHVNEISEVIINKFSHSPRVAPYIHSAPIRTLAVFAEWPADVSFVDRHVNVSLDSRYFYIFFSVRTVGPYVTLFILLFSIYCVFIFYFLLLISLLLDLLTYLLTDSNSSNITV